MSRIAIVGPGAVGSVLAALLHQSGWHELLLCSRRPVGMVRVKSGEREIAFAPTNLTAPDIAPAVDWVFVTTKAYDASGAAAWLPRLCASGAPVAVIQNGVEHRTPFAGRVAPEKLLPVMVDAPAERTPDGVIQRAVPRLVVNDDALGRAFVALFEGSTVEASVTPDFTTAIWRKLCVNAAGVVCALTLQPNGVFRTDEGATLARELIRECVAVARTQGAQLDDSTVESVLAGCRASPAEGVNSLLADRLAGRATEIDARNGVIVRLGQEHGRATPYNAMAVDLFKLLTRPAPLAMAV